jgi:cell division initiation protein
MKITPIEIRQKDFEKTFRGYDKEEVDAFLQALSQEWERAQDEIKELRKRLEQSELEASRLREVEHSLFKTLKTAEDTGASLVEQANKSAELYVKEAQMNAEAILNEARTKARGIIEESEMQARGHYDELKSEMQSMQREFQEIQNLRENFLHDIQSIASDFAQKSQRYIDKPVSNSIEKKIKQVKTIDKQEDKPKVVTTEEKHTVKQSAEVKKAEVIKESKEEKGSASDSFFDTI